MKKFIFSSILALISGLIFFTSAQGQENEKPANIMTFEEAQIQKANRVVTADKKITVLKMYNDRKLISIVDPQLVEQLSLDIEKKELISNLFGVMSMVTFKSSNSIQVLILNDYIENYLTKYFAVSEKEAAKLTK